MGLGLLATILLPHRENLLEKKTNRNKQSCSQELEKETVNAII